MITVNRRLTNHNFEKQNLVTQKDTRGMYDVYKCSLCGVTGKSYRLGDVEISDRDAKKAENCPEAPRLEKIKITKCRAVGRAFDNLTPGSIHDVIDPPPGQTNVRGVWVMGVGEPVKVLFGEFEEA